MLNWIDIIILVIVVFAAVRGGVVGLIHSLVGLVSLIIAFVVANIYYDNLAKLIFYQTYFGDKLQGFFSKDMFLKFKTPSLKLPELSEGFENVNEYLDNMFAKSDFLKDALANSFSGFMSNIIINIISWVIIFIVGYLIVRILGVILEEVFKLPILKSINAFVGFCFGIIKGTLIVFILVLAIQFIGQISTSDYLNNLIESSYFAYYILKFNILRWIIAIGGKL